MRLGWRHTNRQSQIVYFDTDEQSTNSTSLVDQGQQKDRQQQQHQLPPQQLSSGEVEASSSSCATTAPLDRSSGSGSSSCSSLSDDLSSLGGVGSDDDDDSSSSSSLPPPQQQQHSQAFLTTTTSLNDMAVLTANCDIEEDPPYEIGSHNGCGSGGKDRSGSRSCNKNHINNNGSLINRLLPQRQQNNNRNSSSSTIESNEDDDDDEGSEDAVRKSNSEAQQQRQRQRQQLPPDDSLSREHPMSPQHQDQQHQQQQQQQQQQQLDSDNNEMEHNNSNGNTVPLSNTVDYGQEGTDRSSEHVDSNEYEADDQQRPRKRGKQFSKRSNGSNGLGRDESDDDDDSIPDDDGDETDIEDDDNDDDDDDDGSDHEVPLWKPQDTQSVCEFTHTIRDYSAKRDSGCKKAEYSSTTVDNLGNKWRLIVYVNGNGRASNNHLSLFLQVADADDLPFGWKKAVSYVLTLEHPHVGAGLSYAKRNPDKTFKLCPKAIDWGWSQFITSDRIQQESFVSNDSLVVRASVTVKSSSVDIDLDDAELYLKCAVEEGRPDAVQLCLDQGASVNCQFKDDLYTPLHTACSTSPNEDGVNAALGSGGGEHNKPSTAQSKNNNNNTMATHEGSMQVLELLLEKGADGNACNKWRETPLLIAANNGHKAAVEALLKHGADPSLCSEAGWSALTFAAHKGYGDIVELLLDDGAPVNCRVTEDSSTPLHKACAGSKPGHLEAVKLLLESNADVHALNKWRETPLLTAANHGQAGAVEHLLRAGADPCKCTDTGWSPLSIAAYKGHDEVVKLLLEEGAPTEEADPTLSALLQAATKGLPDTVELLLRHGADHTVTTKKGDTALSILVEQNLIDAAVEMVTEYKASIPRCSRDRKKVQRARLLINLRLKQSGGESKKSNSSRKKKKNSAEQQAKAAEEALLLELEMEDAERSKLEQDANKKSAKKRKKKERERQLKKEQDEQRLAEEKKEEAKRKKLQDAKDAAERVERQRLAAAQRKVDEENRRKQEKIIREQQQKEREQRKKLRKEEEERKRLLQQKEANEIASKKNVQTGSNSNNGSSKSSEGQRQSENPFHPTGQTKSALPNNNASSNANKRGWEVLPAKNSATEPANNGNGSKPKIPLASTALSEKDPYMMQDLSAVEDSVVLNETQINPSESKMMTPGRYETTGSPANLSDPINIFSVRVEPPAVSVFRRQKLSELLHRFSAAKGTANPMGSVDLLVAKKVLFRWIMRAAHESSGYVDFMIPSWDDLDKLTTFFQRQFISETRKVFRAPISMESLKEAGTATAQLCHAFAKEVAGFHRQVVDELPSDWNDATVRVTVSEHLSNLGESTVVIDWANQARVTLPGSVFLKLKERFQGVQSQLLSSVFVCKTCYDTKLLLVEDTSMDYSLTPTARLSLASELAVSAEVWSDPLSALDRNSYWGQFAEIDRMFGGLKPFGTNEDLLCQHGGSVSVLAPPDNMLASKYLNRMVDILESCEQANLAVSFAVFLRSECRYTQKSPPSTDDLYELDPRLRDRTNYISRVETLVEGAHFYFSEKVCGPQASTTPSLFVLLQNSLGKNRFPIRNVGILEILGSYEANVNRINEPLQYAPISAPRFLQPPANLPASPTPPQNNISSNFDFGSIGSSIGRSAPSLPTTFGQDSSSGVRRRGRLFDLVDNGEEDTMNDVDVVSGMLGTLNVDDLFQTNSGAQDVDIEAISLMGIGGSSTGFQPSNRTQGRFG